MEISRISSVAPVAVSLNQVNAGTSAATVLRDVGLLQSEIRGSLPVKNAPAGQSALILDAIADQDTSLRSDVVYTIRRQIDQVQLAQNARLLREHFKPKDTTPESLEEFRREAKRYSKGSAAYEVAMIEEILAVPEHERVSHIGFTEEFIHNYLVRYQAQLQAFLNISDVIAAHSDRLAVDEMAGAYEDILVQSQSLLQALGAMVKRIGVDNLAHWSPFLTQSAVADLCSLNIGAEKVQLMFVLQELKSFRILNTFTKMLGDVRGRHLQNRVIDQYLDTSFEYAQQPLVTLNVIERWIGAGATAEQILFFQDYRGVFSKISEEAYKDDEQRRNALFVLQKKIDEMVYSEE